MVLGSWDANLSPASVAAPRRWSMAWRQWWTMVCVAALVGCNSGDKDSASSTGTRTGAGTGSGTGAGTGTGGLHGHRHRDGQRDHPGGAGLGPGRPGRPRGGGRSVLSRRPHAGRRRRAGCGRSGVRGGGRRSGIGPDRSRRCRRGPGDRAVGLRGGSDRPPGRHRGRRRRRDHHHRSGGTPSELYATGCNGMVLFQADRFAAPTIVAGRAGNGRGAVFRQGDPVLAGPPSKTRPKTPR